MPNQSSLPFGSEFSPSQIELRDVLAKAREAGGDYRQFEAAILAAYFSKNATSPENRKKLANNCKLGMQQYGLIDRDANLTEVGEMLYATGDDAALHDAFAKHILTKLPGLTFVQCIQDMQVAGEDVNLNSLREWLEERGISFPRGGKHPSIMRLWLEKAGVFKSGWAINSEKLRDLLGLKEAEIEALSGLSLGQKCFLKTLANLGTQEPQPSNEIEKLATATYGVRFNEKSLPKDVLYPLEKAGFVSLERGTKQDGRGAKPFLVTLTEMGVNKVVAPLLEQLEKQSQPELRPLLRKPLGEVVKELNDPDKHKRGLALEALAFKLMRLLDLTYVATRLRANATGGAEIDVIFESSRLVFSRWQVQCKNTDRVALDDVAKEVGLTHFLKSNVIVIVTTGSVGTEARRYANKIMGDSNLCIVMVEGEDISRIIESPAAIVDVFNREAIKTMELKKLDLD